VDFIFGLANYLYLPNSDQWREFQWLFASFYVEARSLFRFLKKMIILSLTFTIDKFFAKIGGINCNPPIYETIKGHGECFIFSFY
jgi:hypothetical protein